MMNHIMNGESGDVSHDHICPTSHVHYHIHHQSRYCIPMEDNYLESIVPEAASEDTISIEIPTCHLVMGYSGMSVPCLVCRSPLLSAQCLPEIIHRSITMRAYSVATSLARQLHVVNGECAMSIDIYVESWNTTVVTDDDYGERIRRVIQESMEWETFKPATESCIEALEKVKFGGSESMQCSICLEEVKLGMEVVRLPCSHLYHGDCIVPWLKTSHMCPVCRFSLPHEH